MGHLIHNMDILRYSVTFLAFATVIFILSTSWAVFHSQMDQGSCRKLLENARDIKDVIKNLKVDQEKLSHDLETIPGQSSELLRAILASNIDASDPLEETLPDKLSVDVQTKLFGDKDALDTHDEADVLQITNEKNFTMCVFGGSPEATTKLSRLVHCKKPNVTVMVVHSNDHADVATANVTFFTNTVQKYGWWSTLLSTRSEHQRWALASVLPPTTVHSETTIPKGFRGNTFHWTANYNFKSDVPLLFGKYSMYKDNVDMLRPPMPKLQDKDKLLAYFRTDCSPAKWPREKFVEALSTYVKVDVFDCNEECGEDCSNNLKRYKFILALESAPCYGYITDIFWSSLALYDSVPIVWGAQAEDYKRTAPPNSFIDIRNHESIYDLAVHIKTVHTSFAEYEKYHLWRQHGRADLLMKRTFLGSVPSNEQVCSTFEKYIDDYEKPVSFRDTNRDDWLGSCAIRPTDVVEKLPIPEQTKPK